MCQKGSEGRGALLMEIQRRERVILVTPAHGGQVGFFSSSDCHIFRCFSITATPAYGGQVVFLA